MSTNEPVDVDNSHVTQSMLASTLEDALLDPNLGNDDPSISVRPTVDVAALRAAAEAASDCEWAWDGMRVASDGHVYVPECSHLGETLISLDDTYENSGNDCAFIAAADPSTVLALLDRLARAETALRAMVDYGGCRCRLPLDNGQHRPGCPVPAAELALESIAESSEKAVQ